MANEIVTQLAEPSKQLSAETLQTLGDVISKSLLFTLGRNYLDGQVFERNYVQLVEEDISDVVEAAFLQLEQVGQPINRVPGEYLRAIQTFLGAAHDPRYRLLFIISSDGYKNHIYIGVVSRTTGAHPTLFAEQLGQFLASNWPGTRATLVNNYKEIVRDVHVPLTEYRYARSMTGIPSPKTGPMQDMQSLDQFMLGLRGKPYLYMVVAEPMTESDVSGIIESCRTLSGELHAFTKSTINESISRGSSISNTQGTGESTSTSKSTSTSDSESTGGGKSGLGAKLEQLSTAGKIAGGVAGVASAAVAIAAGGVSGAFLLNGMVNMFGQLYPSTNASQSTSTSISDSESYSQSSNVSETTGTNTGESVSFGREYLNKHAEACENLLEQTVERFQIARGQGCWNVGVYLFSKQAEETAQAQAQLKALVSGAKSAFEPIRIHDLKPIWDNGQAQVALDKFQIPHLRLVSPNNGKQVSHPLGSVFEGLTTPLNTEELSLLANLPIREMPGLPVQTTTSFSLNPPYPKEPKTAMNLGNVLDGGHEVGNLTYSVDLDSLTRHIFITGITGSGKSNTCRRLIAELMRNNINFMVIEPAKEEYAQLATAYNKAGTFDREIDVYIPGQKNFRGHPIKQLKLNPFDLVMLPGVEPQVMAHLDRLKSIFNSAFVMQEILPVILEEGLVDLYESKGWLAEELPPEMANFDRPTVDQLLARISILIDKKGYERKITDNLKAAMDTRLRSLLRGWKRNLFNHPRSTPWEELFDRPVVINLQQMGDDADKCFTTGLLLNFLYEYRQAKYIQEGAPEESKLRHLMIVEEAHRILRHMPPGNPQGKMGEMFSDMLAEIRSYGQGFGIIDQVPAKLVPDALKNTNLKIIHRLVANDDRQAMAGTLALTPEQTQVIARLKVGQAIVCGIQDDMASWVQIAWTPLPTVVS